MMVEDEVETQFGIKAYATPNVTGFAAVLKGRFSDFSVREGKFKKMLVNHSKVYLFCSLVYLRVLRSGYKWKYCKTFFSRR